MRLKSHIRNRVDRAYLPSLSLCVSILRLSYLFLFFTSYLLSMGMTAFKCSGYSHDPCLAQVLLLFWCCAISNPTFRLVKITWLPFATLLFSALMLFISPPSGFGRHSKVDSDTYGCRVDSNRFYFVAGLQFCVSCTALSAHQFFALYLSLFLHLRSKHQS